MVDYLNGKNPDSREIVENIITPVAGSAVLDMNDWPYQSITLTENTTISVTPTAGWSGSSRLKVTQWWTGSYTLTISTSVTWTDDTAPTLWTNVWDDTFIYFDYDSNNTELHGWGVNFTT